MKNIKLNVVILLAIIFSAAAAYGVYWYLNGVRDAYIKQGNFVQVAVATQDIPAKTALSSQMFAMESVPSKYINPDAIVDPNEISGKLTKSPVYAGEQILSGRLSGKGDLSEGMAFIVPAGERALTISVNEVSGLAGLIKPGDRVDVLVTFEDDAGTVMTSTILQKIKVLAAGQQMNTEGMQNVPEGIYQTVTLSVTPQQAQPLALATEKGSTRLMLRSHEDEGTANIPASKIVNLVR